MQVINSIWPHSTTFNHIRLNLSVHWHKTNSKTPANCLIDYVWVYTQTQILHLFWIAFVVAYFGYFGYFEYFGCFGCLVVVFIYYNEYEVFLCNGLHTILPLMFSFILHFLLYRVSALLSFISSIILFIPPLFSIILWGDFAPTCCSLPRLSTLPHAESLSCPSNLLCWSEAAHPCNSLPYIDHPNCSTAPHPSFPWPFYLPLFCVLSFILSVTPDLLVLYFHHLCHLLHHLIRLFPLPFPPPPTLALFPSCFEWII